MNPRDGIARLAGLAAAASVRKSRTADGDARSYDMDPGATPTLPAADSDYQPSGRITASAGTSITLGEGARPRWDQYKTLLRANGGDDHAGSMSAPAVAGDPRQYLFPKHGRFAFGGLIFGLLLVLIMAFIEATQRSAAARGGAVPT